MSDKGGGESDVDNEFDDQDSQDNEDNTVSCSIYKLLTNINYQKKKFID